MRRDFQIKYLCRIKLLGILVRQLEAMHFRELLTRLDCRLDSLIENHKDQVEVAIVSHRTKRPGVLQQFRVGEPRSEELLHVGQV